MAKAQAMEAKVCCITEEKVVAAAARWRAMLEDKAKHKAEVEAWEGAEVEWGGGSLSLSKQKGQAEGE